MLPKVEETLGAMYKMLRGGGASKRTEPNSSKISEKPIYLNCSKSLRTELVVQESRGGHVGTSVVVFVKPGFKTSARNSAKN